MASFPGLTIDTSAMLAVLLNEPTRSEVIRHSRGRHLIAPGSLHWETGNAMTALFKKRRLNLRQALQAMEAYRQIPVQLVDVSVDAALQLAWELNIYAYDAFMVECAKRSGTPLLTLDIPLRISASQAGVAVVEL